MLSIGDRIAELKGDRRTVAEFARDLGYQDATVRAWIANKAEPKAGAVADIVTKTGCNAEWLLFGTGDKFPVSSENDAAQPEKTDDIVYVPWLPTRASAGYGTTAQHDEPLRLAMRHRWLHDLGLSPHRVHALTVRGDSMLPSIPDGSLVLVDKNGDGYAGAGIYVVTLNDEVLIKRVQRAADGSYILRSDNDLYDSLTVPFDADGFVIEGRVKWIGRAP